MDTLKLKKLFLAALEEEIQMEDNITNTKNKITCILCNKEKENSFCAFCKTNTPSNHYVSVSDIIKVRDNHKVRKFSAGIKKFLSESLSGWFPSTNLKLPDGVNKSRIIDREKDEYHEVVKKYGTNEVIHETHEPLSEHKK